MSVVAFKTSPVCFAIFLIRHNINSHHVMSKLSLGECIYWRCSNVCDLIKLLLWATTEPEIKWTAVQSLNIESDGV